MRVLYPGTFDPITYGHIDIVRRAVKVFDKILIGVAEETGKRTLFSCQERISLVKKAFRHFKNVHVGKFPGLTVEFARSNNVKVILRGVRMISDFEYEFQMALTNRKIAKDIETVFMMPHPDYSYISSRLIKEAFFLGADVSVFVPGYVLRALKKKKSQS